jgi:hypothetical protein
MSDTAMTEDQVEGARAGIVQWARWGLSHEPPIHYAQSRPIDGMSKPGKLPLSTDCSGFVTLCYKWGGGPDPNGNHFNGYGYTGTILGHCKPIAESQLRPGDLVVFGPGTGDHVVVSVGSGSSAAVVSHGKEAAPNTFSLAVAKRSFRSPVRCVRCPGLDSLAGGDDTVDPDGPSALEPGVQIDPQGTNPPVGGPDGDAT